MLSRRTALQTRAQRSPRSRDALTSDAVERTNDLQKKARQDLEINEVDAVTFRFCLWFDWSGGAGSDLETPADAESLRDER
jgi:hypothetical protein